MYGLRKFSSFSFRFNFALSRNLGARYKTRQEDPRFKEEVNIVLKKIQYNKHKKAPTRLKRHSKGYKIVRAINKIQC